LGGFLGEHWHAGGLLGLFIVSSGCRVLALLPLIFVREHRSMPLSKLMQLFSLSAKSSSSEIIS
jgi:hypothetical protein